jgi:hypothetical protein
VPAQEPLRCLLRDRHWRVFVDAVRHDSLPQR